MIRLIARNIIRFVVVVLIQILVLDNIHLGGYLNPYFYVIFIILLPFETPPWLLLINGFLMGFAIDLNEHTLGLHTFASVFIAFVRPWILGALAPRDGYEPDTFPRVFYYGFTWFLTYSVILVFTHHLILFYTEVFHFQDFLSTFLRVILSTILTTSTIIVSQYFIFRK